MEIDLINVNSVQLSLVRKVYISILFPNTFGLIFKFILGNLRAHILRVHPIPFKGEETFKCTDCPCVFKKLGTLNAHVSRMHTGENKHLVKYYSI